MFRIAPLRLLTPFVTRLGPPELRRFMLNLVPISAVQELKNMSDQMDRTCRDILRHKRCPSRSDAATSIISRQKCSVSAGDHISRSPGEAESMVLTDERDIMSILSE